MKKSTQLLHAIQEDLDPRFKIRAKSSFWLARIHDRFSPGAAVILGHTCYVYDKFFDDEGYMTQLMAHEGVHVAQKRDFGVLPFNWKYGYPQSFAGVLFVLGLICGGIMWAMNDFLYGVLAASGWMLAAVFNFVNYKLATSRAIFELEAYATSWWVVSRSQGLVWDDHGSTTWIDAVHERISRRTYLWCGRSLNNLAVLRFVENVLSGSLIDNYSDRQHTRKWLAMVRRILLDEAQ